MYKAVANSIRTELAADIDATQTTIPVLNASVLQDRKLVVIGSGEIAETIRYESIENNNLIGCERGFQGASKPWGLGTKIARNFTAYDHDTNVENINQLNEQVQEMKRDIEDITPLFIGAETPLGAQAKADAAQTAAERSAQSLANTLQTNLDNYTKTKIYSAPVHGLRLENDKLQFEKPDGSWKLASSDILLSDSITGTRSNVAATEWAVNKAVQAANRPYTDSTFISAVTYKLPKIQPLLRYTYTNIQFAADIDLLGELTEQGVRLKNQGTYYVYARGHIEKKSGSYLSVGSEFILALQYQTPTRSRNDFLSYVYNALPNQQSIGLVGGGVVYIDRATDVGIAAWSDEGDTLIGDTEILVARIR